MAVLKTVIAKTLVTLLTLAALVALGCKKPVYFEIRMTSQRASLLENVILNSDVGRQESFGYVGKEASLFGNWQIFAGETLTVTWVEGGRSHSAKITLTSTNVGPKGIMIEIKADGALTAKPGWHSL